MNTISEIAKSVRIWVENKEIRLHPHKPDLTLTGWCAIASAQLLRKLKNAGIECEIHLHDSDWCHAFVVVEDHVIDVTATQFNEFRRTPVLMLHFKEAEQYRFYQTDQVFYYPSLLRDYQIRHGWPKDQWVLTR